MKHVIRVAHSGKPPYCSFVETFFTSAIVFRLYFFAVVVSVPNASESKNGVLFRSVNPRFSSKRFAARYVAFAVFGDVLCASTCTITPVYSG